MVTSYFYKVNLIKDPDIINHIRLPADHAEPRKSIIKRIASRDGFDIEIWRCGRKLGFVVIHLAHQLQSLSEKTEKIIIYYKFHIRNSYVNVIVTGVLNHQNVSLHQKFLQINFFKYYSGFNSLFLDLFIYIYIYFIGTLLR